MTLHNRFVKRAFIPAPEQQQPGPDGMPVGGADPAAAGGAPPADPAAAGAAPMDPMAAAGGAPPADPMADPAAAMADPAAAGAPPADPAAGAPVDPASGGAPAPVDPTAAGGIDPATGQPITPDQPKPILDPQAQVGHGQADLVMHVVERTLEAFDKSKKNKAKPGAGGAPGAGGDPAAGGGLPPGPVTGIPGDMSAIAGNGPIKTGSDNESVIVTKDVLGGQKGSLRRESDGTLVYRTGKEKDLTGAQTWGRSEAEAHYKKANAGSDASDILGKLFRPD